MNWHAAFYALFIGVDIIVGILFVLCLGALMADEDGDLDDAHFGVALLVLMVAFIVSLFFTIAIGPVK